MTVEQYIQQIREQIRGTWSGYGLHNWDPYYIAENPDYTSADDWRGDYWKRLRWSDDWRRLVESGRIDPMSRVSVSFSEPEPCSPEELEEFLKGD